MLSTSRQQTLDNMLVRDDTFGLLLPEKSEEELDKIAELYQREKIPWISMSLFHKYKLAEKRKRMRLPLEFLTQSEFEIPAVQEVVERFFRNGKPIGNFLGQYVDFWIFFFVTDGRVRSDHNKKTRIFTFERGDLSPVTWSSVLKNSCNVSWDVVRHDDVYPLVLKINDACNDVLTSIRRRIRQLPIKNAFFRATCENLTNHPEFVPFQNNRQYEHKNFRWRFQAHSLGGNCGKCAPPKSQLLNKQSVHFMMRDLHEWLPCLRNKTSKEI